MKQQQEKLLRVPIKLSQWMTVQLAWFRRGNEECSAETFIGGCCIGHHGIAYGVTVDCELTNNYPNDMIDPKWSELWNTSLPRELLEALPAWVTLDYNKSCSVRYAAATINDHWRAHDLTASEAIDLLRPIFKHLGARIVFYKNL